MNKKSVILDRHNRFICDDNNNNKDRRRYTPLLTSVMGSRFLTPYTDLICSGECLGLRHYGTDSLDQGTKG